MSSATEKTTLVSANLDAEVNDANFMHRIKGDCDRFSNQFNHVFCVVNDLVVAAQ